MQYYFSRLRETVLPNVHNLQNCFRAHGLEVIHVRIQSLTRDGRDRGKGHKRLELHAAPGSGDACFLEEVAPQGDEIVINKTASGVFSSTNLHYVLGNLEISSLYVVGVYTNECVETTVRAACDLGYLVTMVEDCCATQTPELHEASLQTLRNRYARIVSTDEAIDDIEQYCRGTKKKIDSFNP
jgi:nicotinamidase-related amidase